MSTLSADLKKEYLKKMGKRECVDRHLVGPMPKTPLLEAAMTDLVVPI